MPVEPKLARAVAPLEETDVARLPVSSTLTLVERVGFPSTIDAVQGAAVQKTIGFAVTLGGLVMRVPKILTRSFPEILTTCR